MRLPHLRDSKHNPGSEGKAPVSGAALQPPALGEDPSVIDAQTGAVDETDDSVDLAPGDIGEGDDTSGA
jgi:hypothetical protein